MKIIEHSLFTKAWHRMTVHNDSQLLSHYSNISSVFLARVVKHVKYGIPSKAFLRINEPQRDEIQKQQDG
jgi:hypothetical protein